MVGIRSVFQCVGSIFVRLHDFVSLHNQHGCAVRDLESGLFGCGTTGDIDSVGTGFPIAALQVIFNVLVPTVKGIVSPSLYSFSESLSVIETSFKTGLLGLVPILITLDVTSNRILSTSFETEVVNVFTSYKTIT